MTEANSKKKDLSAKLDQANQDLADAKAALDNAQKEYDAIVGEGSEEDIVKDFDAKKAALENAQKAYNGAQKDVANLEVQKADAESKVTAAQNAVETAQSELEQAQNSTAAAQEAYNNAYADLQEKKTILDGTQDETLKTQYEADIVDAEAALGLAQTNLQVALQNQTAKGYAVTQAQANVDAVQNEIASLQTQIDTKQGELDTLNQRIASAKTELEKAESTLKDAQTTKDEKDIALAQAKTELQKAEDAYSNQNSIVNQIKQNIDNKDKELEAFEKSKEDALTKYNGGSAWYYIDANEDEALRTLVHAFVNDYTQMGMPGDATNLDMMYATLNYMKEINEIRKTLGLVELKVSPILMAIEQSNINWSIGLANEHNVCEQYNVEQNVFSEVTWNLKSNIDKYKLNNVNHWYYEEKNIYDNLQEEFKNMDVETLKEEHTEIYNSIKDYLNITNPNHTLTGFAIHCRKELINGELRYTYCSGQAFANENTIYDPLHDGYNTQKIKDANSKIYNMNDFCTSFTDYYENIVNVLNDYHQLELEKATLVGTLNDSQLILQDRKDAVAVKQNKLIDMENEMKSIENNILQIQKSVDVRKSEYDKLKNASTGSDIQKAIDALKAQKQNLEEVHFINAMDALDKAMAEKQEADAAVEAHNESVKNAQANLKAKKDILDAMNRGIEEAQKNYDNALATVTDKGNTLARVRKAEADKTTELSALENTLNNTKADLTFVEKGLANAKTYEESCKNGLTKADTAYQNASAKLNQLNEVNNTIVTSNESITRLTAEIKDLQKSISDTDDEITNLTDKKVDLESVKAEIEKAQDAYKVLIVNPEGMLDIVDTDNETVLGLYSKIGAIKTAYMTYSSALQAFLDAQAVDTENVKALDVASSGYTVAKKELDKANAALSDYLAEIKRAEDAKKAEEEARKKAEEEAKAREEAERKAEEAKKNTETSTNGGEVNTGARTALGFYTLSGVLGLAGVAFAGKHARKED